MKPQGRGEAVDGGEEGDEKHNGIKRAASASVVGGKAGCQSGIPARRSVCVERDEQMTRETLGWRLGAGRTRRGACPAGLCLLPGSERAGEGERERREPEKRRREGMRCGRTCLREGGRDRGSDGSEGASRSEEEPLANKREPAAI